MSFTFSKHVPLLLFEGWQAGPDWLSYLFACTVVVAMGVARQELVMLAEQDAHSPEKRACFYFAQSLLAYLLMLLAMTFNVGIFLSVIVGLTAGFYRSLLKGLKVKEDCCG